VRSAQIQPGEVAIVVGAGAIGLSAVAALASRASTRLLCRTTSPNDASWPAIASARTSSSIPGRRRCSTRSTRFARNAVCPAPLSCSSVSARRADPEHRRIRGEWAPGSTARAAGTPATRWTSPPPTRQGVTIQFGGGPHPQDWYGTLDASRPDGWTRYPVWARSSPSTKFPTRSTWPAAPTGHHASWSSERRPRVTEEDQRQDISDVLVRYATGIDRRDWPLFRTLFHR